MPQLESAPKREDLDYKVVKNLAAMTGIPADPIVLTLWIANLKDLSPDKLVRGAAAAAAVSTRGLNMEAIEPPFAIKLCHLSLDCLEALGEREFRTWFQVRDADSDLAIHRDFIILCRRTAGQDGGVTSRFYRLVRIRIGEQEAREAMSDPAA